MKQDFLESLIERAANIHSGKSLFNFVVDHLKQDFDFDDMVFAKINEDDTHSAFLVNVQQTTLVNDLFQEVSADKFPLNDGIADRLIANDEAIILDVLEENKRAPSLGYIRLLKSAGIRSMLAIALRSGDKPIGLLYLQSRKTNNFDERSIDKMSEICGIIALAFSNILFRHKIRESENDLNLQLEANNLLLKSTSFESLGLSLSNLLNCRIGFDLLALNCVTKDGTVEYAIFKKIRAEEFISVLAQFKESLNNKEFKEEKIKHTRKATTAIYTPSELKEMARKSITLNRKRALFGINHLFQFKLPSVNESDFVISMGRSTNEPFSLDDIKTLELIAYQLTLTIDKVFAQDRIEKLSRQLAQQNEYLNEEIRSEKNFRNIVGKSDALHQTFVKISQVAPTSSTVLITGETGTGKELIARAIHDLSPRSSKQFIKINAAAIPDQLIESELFGHEKGSFTGALAQRIGKFELANGGTIFLDEIGEMPIALQAKLLRVLQEQEIERIGGIQTIRLDVRIVAATNRDLKAEVVNKNFREDLYYRLNVFPVHIAPLRERKEDIISLAEYFIEKFSKKLGKPQYPLIERLSNTLQRYNWPGNVRELEHLIEQSMILSKEELSIPMPMSSSTDSSALILSGVPSLTLDEVQKEYIHNVLEFTKGKIRGEAGAAELLGIKPTTLESRMKKLGIHRTSKFD